MVPGPVPGIVVVLTARFTNESLSFNQFDMQTIGKALHQRYFFDLHLDYYIFYHCFTLDLFSYYL